ncbi:adenosylcobinamide-GDP ribazoletransferase [Dechloromonas denitrificans]|uniref:adenosylcobinamide-GDP ribazoletransferase n=1 Tax=Dechloromonas denitrificans TaxID=281362 RepID=UPI001CF919B0|nr:adenosylcobinamide-GDP ribazoletransferase [Dechloromonas denitrificans]UCV03826.1 adenosylcobinamide-GDP ribazoletransferase [Dechloromonas denitrificans]UCV08089.1 adenosylcobinamide-GDP ribazoletransferase [Dechloromonas denitrificans]
MLRRELEYFFGAIRFFTRLPVPGWVGHSAEALNHSARYFPAVGLLIGGLGGLVYLAAALFWPAPVAVLLAMAATIYATGAFHEDGLSDTVDGLGGGWEKQRILEIMKDSRVGSYGAVATVLALLGKFTLLVALDPALLPLALLAGHAVSRFCATLLLAGMDYARDDQLSKAKPLANRLSGGALLVALVFVLAALVWLPWPQAVAGCALAALATLWLAGKFKRWLGGYTGDCLGAVQQVSEIVFYLGLLAHWPN